MTTTAWISIFLIVTASDDGAAAGADRLIDHPPYDELTLADKGDGEQVLRLVPLEMEKREPLRERDRGEWLVVRLLERSNDRYQVRWRDIARVRLFEEIVLAEAARLEDTSEFEQTYEYYEFLARQESDFPGAQVARHRCLAHEAESCFEKAQYDRALALWNELYQRDAGYPGLQERLDRVVDHLVETHIASLKYVAARHLLESLASKFAGDHVVAVRQEELTRLADEFCAKAGAAAEQRQWREAHSLVRSALRARPDLQAARQMASELNREYPVVSVGVRESWNRHAMTVPLSWSNRRCQLLIDRLLFEMQSYGEDGGSYHSGVSSHRTQEACTTLTLDSHIKWPHNGRPISGVDIAGSLLALRRCSDVLTADEVVSVIDSVGAVEANSIDIHWRRELPWWPSLLQVRIVPWDHVHGISEGSTGLGPYRPVYAGDDSWEFVLHGADSTVSDGQPREIVETPCHDVVTAISALRQRTIDVFDRVTPWEIPLIRSQSDLELVPYAAPTVHLLLANPHSRSMSNELVRRAVAKALDRRLILRESLGVSESEGGEVLTGIFPVGQASDMSIGELDHDPRLAVALFQSWGELGGDGVHDRRVTLVHANNEVARRACSEIRSQLHLEGLGLEVALKESPAADFSRGPGRGWDLWYVEWQAMEPLRDASVLFGPRSVLSPVSVPLAESLGQLNRSTSRAEAIAVLHDMDRHVRDSAVVIPLWQINEFAVVHRSLRGIGSRPVSLYQNIDQWRLTQER